MKNFESKIATVRNSLQFEDLEEIKRASINDRADVTVKVDHVYVKKIPANTKSDTKTPRLSL